LADGDITVAFSTQRELKSSKGEVRDEIEIAWTIEGVEGSTPSGGQGKKIEISVGLALMDLVAAREGTNVDLIALDEVLDGLDREGRARVLQLLQDLRARRSSIFVVSHETDVSEVFEKTITVVKEDGIARLEA
jgi:DNA repair exonuclease SbcCD ATPase subunit